MSHCFNKSVFNWTFCQSLRWKELLDFLSACALSEEKPNEALSFTRGQCYKTFYCSNLLPFHGNTIILCYKAILPW